MHLDCAELEEEGDAEGSTQIIQHYSKQLLRLAEHTD